MDELRRLIELVGALPHDVLLILAGYMVYKLAIVGSIYGVIRFVTKQLFDWLKLLGSRPRTSVKPDVEVKTVELRATIDGLCICTDSTNHAVIAQLMRIRGRRTKGSQYIHHRDADWLREAIDEKEAKDIVAESAPPKA